MEQVSLLTQVQMLVLFLDIAAILWFSIENIWIKRPKRNKGRRLFTIQSLFILSIVLSGLYAVDFVINHQIFDIFLTLLWLVNVYVWNKSLKQFPELIEIEGEINRLENEFDQTMERIKKENEKLRENK